MQELIVGVKYHLKIRDCCIDAELEGVLLGQSEDEYRFDFGVIQNTLKHSCIVTEIGCDNYGG